LELLESLRDIVHEPPNIRILLTRWPHIQGEAERPLPFTKSATIKPTREDIRKYLKMKLNRDTEPHEMGDSLRTDIMEIIPEALSEV